MSTTTTSVDSDVYQLEWAAEQLSISLPTAYRLAQAGELPGAMKVGHQWRISGARFRHTVHGEAST